MKCNSGNITIGDIGINVSDIEISKVFYQEVLGLRRGDESRQVPLRYALMMRDGSTVLTLWENSTMRLRKCPPALHRLAFVFDSAEEIGRTKGLLKNLGARWSEKNPLSSQPSRSAVLHFEDPDGIPIEVRSADRADSVLEENAHIEIDTGIPKLCA